MSETTESRVSAEDQIGAHFESEQRKFAAWFNDENDADDAAVLEVARELGYQPDAFTPDDDESVSAGETREEYDERILDEAREYITEKRDNEGALDEQILGVSTTVTVTVRVELSTGGPADYVTAEVDPRDGSLSDVEYHFAPWFDHASVSVPSGSPLYRLVERFSPAYDGSLSAEQLHSLVNE